MIMLNSLNPIRMPDFNGDGKTDLFWRSPVTNQTAVWLLDGSTRTQGSFLADVSKAAGWQDPKFGDFNGDGKTDLFWRNSLTGENALWLMDGDRLLDTSAFITPVAVESEAYVGNFDQDGKTDLVWHDPITGKVSLWKMDGVESVKTELAMPLVKGLTAQVGDFNGDGLSDLIWQNRQTGESTLWLFSETDLPTVQNVGIAPNSGQFILVDFNGDGKTDFFDRNLLTGENQVWLTKRDGSGLEVDAIALPGLSRDLSPLVGDFNGDGRTDFFWQKPGAAAELWLANSQNGLSITALPSTGGEWIPILGDFNGDTQADLFWQNAFTGETAIWLQNGRQIMDAKFSTPTDASQQWRVIL
jgi:hypothetical protein